MGWRVPLMRLVLLLWMTQVASCATGQSSVQPRGPLDQLLARGEKAYQDGQYRETIRLYKEFTRSVPEDPRLPQAHLRLGQAYFALSSYSASREHLEVIVRDFPASGKSEEARLFLSRLAYREGDANGSLAMLRKLLRDARSRDVLAVSHLFRGRIFMERGDLGLALTEWKKSLLVIGGGEESLPLYEEMVLVLEGTASEEELARIARETPGEFPGDISLFVMGKRVWEGGEPIRASQIFEKFFVLFPTHPLVQEAQGYLNQGTSIQSLSRVRVGCIAPLTGPLKEVGKQVLQGTQLSIDRLNAMFLEKKIELVVKDTGEGPQKARAAMEELAMDPTVVAVIGPLISRSVVEAAMVAEDAHLPVITPTATAEGIGEMGSYIFRNAMTNAAQAKTIAQYALEQLGLRNFVILYPDDYYGNELKQLFTEECTALGGVVLSSDPYERGAVDYGPQIRRIIQDDIQRVMLSNAAMIEAQQYSAEELFENYYPSFDAVYLPGYAEDVGLIIPQLAYYNIESVQLLGSHNWNDIELIRRGEHFVEGAVFTDGFFVESPHTDIAEFVSGYRRVYGEEPTLFSAQAYDASEMILQALYRGGRSREDIQRMLLAQENFPGVSGLTTVLLSGEMDKGLFLIRVDDGFFRQIN